ncbi:MAG: hypothetical protein RIQ60_3813 [Pseudomonadota bacterium]|jgi:hypothetical protein
MPLLPSPLSLPSAPARRLRALVARSSVGTHLASLAAALALLLGAAGGVLYSSGSSAAGIADTKHNLGSGAGLAGRNQVTDTAEICVFCHTPHGGNTDAPAPLWNKRLGANGAPAGGGTYTTYASLNTPSLDGQVAPVGSISMACLSCHDGTQAMDNIINAPGSGGFDTTGGGNDGRTYSWAGSTVNAAGALSSGVALIGTDLSNDHPIGIQYCGGGLTGSGTTVSGTCRDSDFKAPQTQTINGNQIFWVDTGGAGKQRTDLPLYVRPGETLATGPLVECASCHDPHVSSGQTGPAGTGQTSGETFLRISNASSAVCTSCHVK